MPLPKVRRSRRGTTLTPDWIPKGKSSVVPTLRGEDPNLGLKFMFKQAGTIVDDGTKVPGLELASADQWGVFWMAPPPAHYEANYWLRVTLRRTVGYTHVRADLVTVEEARRLWTEFTARELALRFVPVGANFTSKFLVEGLRRRVDERAGKWQRNSIALEWRRVMEGQHPTDHLLVVLRPGHTRQKDLRRVGRFAKSYFRLLRDLGPHPWESLEAAFLEFFADHLGTPTAGSVEVKGPERIVELIMLERPEILDPSLKGRVFGFDPRCGRWSWLERPGKSRRETEPYVEARCGLCKAEVGRDAINEFRAGLWRERLAFLASNVAESEWGPTDGSF
jgi:hypothetical protein